jgi:hypothetical protein
MSKGRDPLAFTGILMTPIDLYDEKDFVFDAPMIFVRERLAVWHKGGAFGF